MTAPVKVTAESRHAGPKDATAPLSAGSAVALPHVHVLGDSAEPLGWIAIDSLLRSRAHGGVRMSATVDEAELRALARTMTLKYGYLRQPFGGGKAGIRSDPEVPPDKRRAHLLEFAQAARPLLRRRIFVPAPDMGTDVSDIRLILDHAGVRVSPRQLKVSRSGWYTALTTFHSAAEAARQTGVALEGARAAVEGFGKVGASLARLLDQARVRIVAISTSHGALYDPSGLDIDRLAQLSAEFGSRFVERYTHARALPSEALATLPVDWLFPCAGYHTIDASYQADVLARIVCPGANNALSEDAEAALSEREVLVVPDFVANCGGVLGSVLEFASIPPAQIEQTLRTHTETHLRRLLAKARQQGVALRPLAEALATRRFQAMSRSTTSAFAGPFEFGMALYRVGVVPPPLFRALAGPVISKRLAWQGSDDP